MTDPLPSTSSTSSSSARQAGLAVAYNLSRQAADYIVLDAVAETSESGATDGPVRLFTPAEYDTLPGMPFPGTDGATGQGRGRGLAARLRRPLRAAGPPPSRVIASSRARGSSSTPAKAG